MQVEECLGMRRRTKRSFFTIYKHRFRRSSGIDKVGEPFILVQLRKIYTWDNCQCGNLDLMIHIPKNGTQAGGAPRASELFDLDVALVPLTVPVLLTPSTPTCSGRASMSADVAFRRYLNSPGREVNFLRSSNIRCSQMPSLCQ